jgi:hypothetical protein
MERGRAHGGINSLDRQFFHPIGLTKVGFDPRESTPDGSDRFSSKAKKDGIQINAEGVCAGESSQQAETQRAGAATHVHHRKPTPQSRVEDIEHRFESTFPIRYQSLLLPIPTTQPRLPIRFPGGPWHAAPASGFPD